MAGGGNSAGGRQDPWTSAFSNLATEDGLAQIEGECRGYFLFGQNPAVGSANTRMQRLGMASLDWLVVRDLVLIESATWWKDGQEIETGELRTEDIGAEVFFLPAAAHTEKAVRLYLEDPADGHGSKHGQPAHEAPLVVFCLVPLHLSRWLRSSQDDK